MGNRNELKKGDCDSVLVGVLKDKRDLEILKTEKWYRIPLAYAPRKKYKYLAFYQPLGFGKDGKCIKYYGEVAKRRTFKRIELLPEEKDHPRANDNYLKLTISDLTKLKKPIKNIIPRRVVFGFTTLEKLLHAQDLLELYNIAPTEQVIEEGMRDAKIAFVPQYYVCITKKKRFRLDFAVFCKNGQVAIECDNRKAHASKQQKVLDRKKDLLLTNHGWTVIRLDENEILNDFDGCINQIKKTVTTLGGQPTSTS